MDTQPIVVAAFYKFAPLEEFEQWQKPLLAFCDERSIRGTILLASEGMNGTVAGTREAIDELLAHLKSDERFSDLDHKESYADEIPFLKLKIRLKKEIVALGVTGVDPTKQVGEYVVPKDWNTLISDPDVIIIDTRNNFEVDIGTFRGAKNPETKSFRDFPAYVAEELADAKNKKIAMFCTGGIRCEKATSYLLGEGFQSVYHLQGGILKYLEEIPEEESLFEGDCFVFDERIALDHDLEPSVYPHELLNR